MTENAEMFERNLPPYLAQDLDAWKKGVVGNGFRYSRTYLAARCGSTLPSFGGLGV